MYVYSTDPEWWAGQYWRFGFVSGGWNILINVILEVPTQDNLGPVYMEGGCPG